MRKTSKLAVCGVLSLSMAAMTLSGCGSKNLDGTQTALVIDGENISLGLANFFLRYDQATTYVQMSSMMAYLSDSGDALWSVEADDDGTTYGETFKDSELETIESLIALRNHASDYGVELTDDEKSKVDEVAQTVYDKNEAAFTKMGTSLDNVKEAVELYTIKAKMQKPMVADTDREVSDEEAAQSTMTYARLSIPDDEDEAATAKEQVQEALDKVLESDDPATCDIASICEEVNEDFYSSDYSFDQGDYSDDNNVLDSAVKEVLQTLSDGEVYDQVVEGDKYYFIVRMDQSFDREATDEQKESIISERENELYSDTLEGWTDAMEVETKSCWDKLTVTDKQIYTTADEESDTTTTDTTTTDTTVTSVSTNG